jgi:hypothetical protein
MTSRTSAKPATSSKPELPEFAAEGSWSRPAQSRSSKSGARSRFGGGVCALTGAVCARTGALGVLAAEARLCANGVVTTTRGTEGVEVETCEPEVAADVAVLVVFGEAAPGGEEGCGELTACEDGGACGVGSAFADWTASVMAPRAHTATTPTPPRSFACLALTTRVSPLLSPQSESMLAQCEDQDNDRDHGREGHDDAVRDEYRSRDPRSRVGRSAARRVP